MSGQSLSNGPRDVASFRLARHASQAQFEHLSGRTLGALQAFILDTVGVGLAGCASPYAGRVRAFAARAPGVREASIWGFGDRVARRDAAFCNAFLAHCQEYDCVHEAAVLHPFTVVTPVVLAEAEACTSVGAPMLNGRDVLCAVNVGVDIAAGLGVAATTPIRFFRPAVYGLFGAVAALARARQLDETTTAHAFGYALAFASGTMQAHSEGTPALAIQVANAARCAFDAVDLACAALPGPLGAIDGAHGVLALFEAGHDLDRLIKGLDGPPRADSVSWKPFPTGRAAHGGLDLMGQALAAGITADAIARVTIEAPPLIHHLVGRPIEAAPEVNYARLCLPFLAASMLRHGRLDLTSFTPDQLRDSATLALARRIEVIKSAVEDPAAFTPQRATITLHDGGVFTATVSDLLGSPPRPLSAKAQHEKLNGCFSFSGLGFAPDAVSDLISVCADLPALKDCAALVRAVTPQMDGQGR
jgi:2-methylcitrate dehydratase PrpD